MKQVRANQDQCNQWVRPRSAPLHELVAHQPCCEPAAFQSARAGQRWCSPCRDAQLADARRREAAARRDAARLSHLLPVAKPLVRKTAP